MDDAPAMTASIEIIDVAAKVADMWKAYRDADAGHDALSPGMRLIMHTLVAKVDAGRKLIDG